MDYLDQFEIPVQSMQFGLHQYSFDVDNAFFECFSDAPLKEGKFKISLGLDKRENEFLLDFDITGDFEAPCDRCLADIRVPAGIKKLIWVRYGEEDMSANADEDLFYLKDRESGFNVSSIIYELIILSIPFVKRYDCENDPNAKCDQKVLSYLQKEEEKSEGNSIADKLKKLRNN